MGRKRAYPLCPKNVHSFDEVDFAIIGSGPSALGLAIRLRLEYPSQKIVLFEKNSNVGGGLHSFKLLGQTFESGTHYLGTGAIEAFQKILPTKKCPSFVPLCSPEGCMAISNGVRVYDSLRVDGVQVDLSADRGRGGWDSWERSYLLTFPEEKVRIHRFRVLLQTVSGLGAQIFFGLRALHPFFSRFSWYVDRAFRLGFHTFARLSQMTLQEAFLECDIQPHSKLGTLLAAQGGNYGLPPSEAGFLMHAAMVKHYAMGGAFMPEGGCQSLVDACVSHLQETGSARLFMGAEVYCVRRGCSSSGEHYVLDVLKRKPNLVDEKIGDTVQERYRFKAKNLIVATCFGNIRGIVSPRCLPIEEKLSERDNRSSPEISGSFIFLFCTLRKRIENHTGKNGSEQKKMSVEASNELFGNIWVHPAGWDLESAHRMREISSTGKHAPMSYLVSRRGMKITVIGTAEWKWCRQTLPKGGAADVAWRTCMTEKLLAALDRSNVVSPAPGKKVRDYVERYRLGTPLCIRKFLSARRGNAYGSRHTPPRFSSIGYVVPSVDVTKNGEGLWRTGQDVVTAGIAGALASAEVTFFSIKLARWTANIRNKVMHILVGCSAVAVVAAALSIVLVW
jgi:all-trans-retinol 13,14-reductase